MHYDLIFLLEERSAKNVIESLLPKIISDNHLTYICLEHQGKQDLAKSIPRKLKAFSHSPDTKFIVIHDQDSNDCKTLKSQLYQLCNQAGNSDVLIRIICRELESWFLGDLNAVEQAYSLKEGSLSRKQNQAKFRNPDSLNSAKQELKNLLEEYYPGVGSKKIAPHLSLKNNTSTSFQTFVSGVKKLIGTEL